MVGMRGRREETSDEGVSVELVELVKGLAVVEYDSAADVDLGCCSGSAHTSRSY